MNNIYQQQNFQPWQGQQQQPGAWQQQPQQQPGAWQQPQQQPQQQWGQQDPYFYGVPFQPVSNMGPIYGGYQQPSIKLNNNCMSKEEVAQIFDKPPTYDHRIESQEFVRAICNHGPVKGIPELAGNTITSINPETSEVRCKICGEKWFLNVAMEPEEVEKIVNDYINFVQNCKLLIPFTAESARMVYGQAIPYAKLLKRGYLAMSKAIKNAEDNAPFYSGMYSNPLTYNNMYQPNPYLDVSDPSSIMANNIINGAGGAPVGYYSDPYGGQFVQQQPWQGQPQSQPQQQFQQQPWGGQPQQQWQGYQQPPVVQNNGVGYVEPQIGPQYRTAQDPAAKNEPQPKVQDGFKVEKDK